MNRFAIIRAGSVDNVILLDDDSDFDPGEGAELVAIGENVVSPGDLFDGATFSAPVPVLTLDELRAAKRGEVEAELAERFAAGYSPATGPLAGHTLQVRDIEDRTNWLTSQAAYAAAVHAGFGDVLGADFRTAANRTVSLTFAEGLDVLVNGMAAWGRALMARSWALKDWVADDARTAEELQAFDARAAWDAAGFGA